MDAIPNLLIYEGVQTERGEDGCLLGHLDIIKDAQDAGAKMVFVVEDDCQFTDHWRWYEWQANALWAQEQGYDVLVGGCVQTYNPRVVRTRGGTIIEVEAFHSAHCLVYMESAYDKIIDSARQPFDVSIGRDAHCRVVMTWPFVAVQCPSYSGILHKHVNYVPLYEQYEEHLGRQLGLL